MSTVTWRALPAWPHPPQPRQRSQYRTGWARSLDKLQEEIERRKHVGRCQHVIGVLTCWCEYPFTPATRDE